MSGEVQAAAVLGGFSRERAARGLRSSRRPRAAARIGLGDWLLPVYTVLAFVFLLIPIVYTFVFSFNDSIKSNIAWRGFTLDKWLNVCNVEGGAVCEAFAQQHRDRPRRDGHRDDARHDDRDRARALPVPRPVGDQPAAVPADGDARGRARRRPRRAVPRGRRRRRT